MRIGDEAQQHFEKEAAERLRWIASLQRGENPLTPEVIETLRGQSLVLHVDD